MRKSTNGRGLALGMFTFNAKIRVAKCPPSLENKGLTSDQMIEFVGTLTAKKSPAMLRRGGYCDLETGKHYLFLTNNFKLATKTIADIYKARRDVELVLQVDQVEPENKILYWHEQE